MTNPRRDYFDIIFSVVITSFTVILLVGQMVYISIGLTIGIADWGLEGVLVIGLGIFGPMIVGGMALTLFAAWKYWRVDDDGIANGNLFHETKLMFKEIESLEVKIVVIGAKPFVTAQEELCFIPEVAAVFTFFLFSKNIRKTCRHGHGKRIGKTVLPSVFLTMSFRIKLHLPHSVEQRVISGVIAHGIKQ